MPLLSVREAARLLGVCSATVYKLCATGELPHARVLNAVRILPADLVTFVLARRTKDVAAVRLRRSPRE
jgi:excisionase family DNA binding protein